MPPQHPAIQTFSPTDPRVTWVGRTAPFERISRAGSVRLDATAAMRFAWSGSGFVVRFSGTGLGVSLSDPGNLFTVVVDDEVGPILTTSSGLRRYTLASDLHDTEHQVEVYRRTEPMFGATDCTRLEVVNGTLLPPTLTRRRLEIIGDSISCGYGNEAEHAAIAFAPETQNHYLSYGALLARKLGAELSTIAWSGRGVVRNYNNEAGPRMPQLYQRTLPTDECAWSFNVSPDVTLLNLGTNDFAVEPGPQESTFTEGYVQLLRDIRDRHPKTRILATLGPMLPQQTRSRVHEYIANAVAARQRAGDPLVFTHKLETQNLAPGSDEHPSVATHVRMAAELAPVVAALFGATP